MDKDVHLGNHFKVTRMVEKALGKVDAVKVTRRGMVFYHVYLKSKRSVHCGAKLSTLEVDSFDFRSRAKVKGDTSGIPLEIDNQYLRQNIPGVVNACRLTPMENGKKGAKLICIIDV